MPWKGLTKWSAIGVHRACPQAADKGKELALAVLPKPVLPIELPRVLVDEKSRLAAIPAAVAIPFPDETSHRVSDWFAV
jgi:hypothetical protein